KLREQAHQLSEVFSWEKQFTHYEAAYSLALQKSLKRKILYQDKPQVHPIVLKEEIETKPNWRHIVIKEELPEMLKGLRKLSRNLWWSWNNVAEELFKNIDIGLWHKSHYNPVLFLQSLSYSTIKSLVQDKIFQEKLNVVEQQFDLYMEAPLSQERPLITYFSMEYGIHNSLKLYSGGLGILAGDYLKEASDKKINIIGIGLLYKYGYYRQQLA